MKMAQSVEKIPEMVSVDLETKAMWACYKLDRWIELENDAA